MGDMGAMGAMSAVGGTAVVVTVLKYVLITLGGGLALGLVGGLIYAGLRYPNPNKRQMFTPLQKIIVMIIAALGVALIIFAFVKKPKPEGDMMVSGSDISMVDGAGDGGEPAVDADGNPIEGESGEDSEEESSSESTAEATPPVVNGGNVIIGGGGFAMARPMM